MKPFAVIRIVTTPRRLIEASGGTGLPGNWFRLDIAPKSYTRYSLPTWHAQLQPNGFPVHSRGVTTGIDFLGSDESLGGPDDSPKPRSLGAAVASQVTLPSTIVASCSMPLPSSKCAIAAALDSIADVARVRVRDVGQASFSSLCDKDGKALLHFDVGLPISFNGHTAPKAFDLDPEEKPTIVLSHWDWDHLHSAFIFPHLRECTWIVPDQRLGPGAARLARILAASGKLLVHPSSAVTTFPSGCIQQASGPEQNNNDSGLILSASLLSGRKVLFTGDSDYRYLPPTLGASDALVATHHGARLQSGSKAIPVPATNADTLLLSFGKRNVYRHPDITALSQHRRAGWKRQIATASTVGGARGDKDFT